MRVKRDSKDWIDRRGKAKAKGLRDEDADHFADEVEKQRARHAHDELEPFKEPEPNPPCEACGRSPCRCYELRRQDF